MHLLNLIKTRSEYYRGKLTVFIILAAIKCQVPVKSESAVFSLYDRNNASITDRQAGQFVPEFTRIERQCADGHLLPDGGDTSISHYCSNESVWYPPLRPCEREYRRDLIIRI